MDSRPSWCRAVRRPWQAGAVAGRRTTGGAATTVGWREVAPAPVVLVTGTEEFLAERALDQVRELSRRDQPDLEVVDVDAALYEKDQLATWTSPSLFGEPRLVRVVGVEQASDAFLEDAVAYLDHLQDDVVLLLRHAGGQRGRKLLEAVRATPQALVVDCAPLKAADRVDFAATELRLAGRRFDSQAVRALVDAVGSDLRELAASCAQLLADVPPTRAIEVADVDRYHGGRAEVTGFKVADVVVAGQREHALLLLRQALDAGTDPIPVLAALAAKVRTLVKVGSAGPGRPADLAKQLGMAPWQVERAHRDLRGWTPQGLAAALHALADADVAVKGGGRDPVYAAEKAVIAVAAARG